jgi:hypothetical protein
MVQLSDLSVIDRDTIDLRGLSGGFKPENPAELKRCLRAMEQGASRTLRWWVVTDYPKAIRYREDCQRFGVPIDPLV